MKAHRTDNLSLFFGLLFLLVSAGYLAHRQFKFDLPDVGWFIAGGVIFLGAVMTVTALVPDKARPAVETEPEPQPVMEEAEAATPPERPMLAE